jgi:hypothetical protein
MEMGCDARVLNARSPALFFVGKRRAKKMMERNPFRQMTFHFVTVFIVLCVFCPFNLFGDVKVGVKDGLITLDLMDADLSDTLKEIEKASGVKITIAADMPAQKIPSFRVTDFPLAEALRWLWNDVNSYCVYTLAQDPANKNKDNLKEIKVYGDVIGTKPYKGKTAIIEISYGDGEKEVGLIIPAPKISFQKP